MSAASQYVEIVPPSCPVLQGFFGRECANEALALEYNKPISKAEAFFEYDYYSLPEVAARELSNTVEVKVQAAFSSSDGYSDWVSARPELLLLKVPPSCPHLTRLSCCICASICWPAIPSGHDLIPADKCM